MSNTNTISIRANQYHVNVIKNEKTMRQQNKDLEGIIEVVNPKYDKKPAIRQISILE